jgi:hypothetical protein
MSDEQAPFWLVVMHDTFEDAPKCIECKDQKAFEDAYRTNVLEAENELYAFAFRGTRIQLSALTPIGAYVLGEQTVQVGKDATMVDASGHILPLVPKPRKG